MNVPILFAGLIIMYCCDAHASSIPLQVEYGRGSCRSYPRMGAKATYPEEPLNGTSNAMKL